MAVKRVIFQQFSMRLNYIPKESPNIYHYQPSVQYHRKVSDSDFMIPDILPLRRIQQTASSSSDDEHYGYKRGSESSDSLTATPSEASDEEIQTILDNVFPNDGNNNDTVNKNNARNNILQKCGDEPLLISPLQSRRGKSQPLFICLTPSGWGGLQEEENLHSKSSLKFLIFPIQKSFRRWSAKIILNYLF